MKKKMEREKYYMFKSTTSGESPDMAAVYFSNGRIVHWTSEKGITFDNSKHGKEKGK